MKKIFTIYSVLFSLFLFSQNEYKTKLGLIFRVGDSITIAKPSTLLSSGITGTSAGEWNSIFTLKNEKLTNVNFINKKVIIEKIEIIDNDAKFYVEKFNKKLYIKIENAILSNEIIFDKSKLPFVNNSNIDKYDKLKKIKELLDSGALTKEEFEIEKKKILNEN